MIGESALGGPGGAGLGSSRAVPELLWANLKLGVGLPGLSQWPEGGRTAAGGSNRSQSDWRVSPGGGAVGGRRGG